MVYSSFSRFCFPILTHQLFFPRFEVQFITQAVLQPRGTVRLANYELDIDWKQINRPMNGVLFQNLIEEPKKTTNVRTASNQAIPKYHTRALQLPSNVLGIS